MAARTRFFRAGSLILSPSTKSIARLALPSRPALKSLSGSRSCAPWAKVSFTLPLWALATAIIPSRDHTGLPIHFHSSMISGSAARMALRTPANVLPRQSVSSAIIRSIRSDGFIGSFSRSGEAGRDRRFLFFDGYDHAFAEPHAADKAVFQRELMVERGRDVDHDQNGQ